MESVEAEGSSIDDAIERALQRLGVTRDKVDIEIVSNASRGLFGFGGRRAKVRATLRRPLSFVAAAEAPAPPNQPAPPRRDPPASPSPPASRTPTPPAVPSRAQPAAARPQPSEHRRQAPPGRPAPPRQPPAQRPPRPPRPSAPVVALSEEAIERARAVLTEVVRLAGSDGGVEVARDADTVRLVITGDPSGLLIGRRGQTLDALEYLLHRIVAHDDEAGGRLIVDAGDYRVRRRQSLEQLTRQVAERARRSGKPLSLSPMSPRDRRTVHLALQDDPTLTTRSAGTGFYRKVVIIPAGARRSAKPKE